MSSIDSNSNRLDLTAAVVSVIAGDLDAFRPLVAAYEPAVFGLCRQLLGGRDDEAEDVAQETFVRAYRYLPRLKDPECFGAWLYRIARSLCRERRRRQQAERRAMQVHAEAVRRELIPGQSADVVAHLGGALDELPPAERQVIVLRYFEGLSYQDVCRAVGLSFSQVDHLIRKARSRLARRLHVRMINE